MAREKVEVQVKLDVADAQKQLADAQKESKKARAEADALGGPGSARATRARQRQQFRGGGAGVGAGLRAAGGGALKALGLIGVIYVAVKTLLTLVRSIGQSIGQYLPGVAAGIESVTEGVSEAISKITTIGSATAETKRLQEQAAAAGLNVTAEGTAAIFSSVKAAAEREAQRRDRAAAKAGADTISLLRGLTLGGAG